MPGEWPAGDWTAEELALLSAKREEFRFAARALERHLAEGGENTQAVRKRVIDKA